MTSTSLPSPEPEILPEVRPFWSAAAEGRLVIPRCNDCESWIWYPRAFCPKCYSTDVAWNEVSGRGSIYTYSVVRRGHDAYRPATPYVLAYVELDIGLRIITNIVDYDAQHLRIGAPVRAVFTATEAGNALVRFTPVVDDAR